MNIYQSDIGDSLTDPLFFTSAIRALLEEEEKSLRDLCRPFRTILEIGCTKGRYANTVTELGKHYVGIDIAHHHITDARLLHQHNDRVSFVCGDAHNLASLLALNNIQTADSLVVFPFNSFGNLDDGSSILQMLKSTTLSFVIFTYATDAHTLKERTRYYSSSGFNHLSHVQEQSGIRVIDPAGLNSIAYNQDWFIETFSSLDLPYHSFPVTAIGRAYTNITR